MKILFVLLLTTHTWARPLEIKKEEQHKLQDTTYTAIPPFKVELKRDHHIFTLPEEDFKYVFFILPAVGSMQDIALKAWRHIDKDFKLPIDKERSPSITEGWEKLHKIIYQVPVEDSRVVLADIAILKGKAYVALLDSKIATLDKRHAQISIVGGSWKPNALKVEKLGEREPLKLSQKEFNELEQFLKQSMRDFKIPGMQVAIVQDGKIVWDKAFGVKKFGEKNLVTPDTLFRIGSTTKPLTTLLQARLVDQEKLKWETPLTQLLPDFSLADPDATKKMQLIHTACACTGMPRQDVELITEFANVTAEERLKQLKQMKPTTGFGETFQYSNILVAVGGFAAAHTLYPQLTLGTAYDKAMREQVFLPLGLKNSFVYTPSDRPLAEPHAYDLQNRLRPFAQSIDDMVNPVAPAGSVWSTASDMARYVLFELGEGELEGQRILSKESIELRRQASVKVSDTSTYGRGLITSNYKGLQILGHDGDNLGFSSGMSFIPEKKIGWVLLINARGSGLRNIFQQKLFEIIFKADRSAGNARSYLLKRFNDDYAKARKEIPQNRSKDKWISAFAGQWYSPELGSMTISDDGKRAQMDMGEWQSEISTYLPSKKGFITTSVPFSGMILLQVQDDGSLLLDAGQHKYFFKRKTP